LATLLFSAIWSLTIDQPFFIPCPWLLLSFGLPLFFSFLLFFWLSFFPTTAHRQLIYLFGFNACGYGFAGFPGSCIESLVNGLRLTHLKMQASWGGAEGEGVQLMPIIVHILLSTAAALGKTHIPHFAI